MSQLDEQLAKADAQARRDPPQPPAPSASRLPSDRWLVVQSTHRTRRQLKLTVALALALGLGIGSIFLLTGGNRGFAIIAAISLAPVAIVGWRHLSARQSALAREQAFVASLPFDASSYLTAMRLPPMRKRGRVEVLRATVRVRLATLPSGDVMSRLCSLVPSATARLGPDGYQIAGGTVDDPWPWVRAVLTEVLVPLHEVHPVTLLEISLERDLVEPSHD